jgi:dTDP-glucose pyrophosphorylase
MRLGIVESLTTSADQPLREAMRRINAAGRGKQFLLVIDGAGRLVGTLTDGDIRRAILDGRGLDSPVADSMNRRALTGQFGNDEENAKVLRERGAVLQFLPVVDAGGVLRDVLLWDGSAASTARALVMAGGFGRRLGDLTRETPKPLLEVGGRPLLDHVLSRIEGAGISKIAIACHFQTERIREFVNGRPSIAEITIVEETEPLGTAGAVGLLDHRPSAPLLVTNADVLSDFDVAGLISFHERHQYDGTICVKQHHFRIDFGVVRHGDDGSFLGVEEKPSLKHFILAGTYLLSPAICALVTRGERIDMPDVLNLARSTGLRLGLFPIHEAWIDVGRPADLEAARQSSVDNTSVADDSTKSSTK